nr:PREDICTED: LOW QUALITY PROTEIN: putative SNAP25 homologous protein SNAP30 [Musa acuminata subsp. malaccensis]
MQEGLQNQSVQELENYAAYKAEETTHKVNDCLKIAQVIREDASDILVMLHQQGEQITRTHETTVSIDHDLSRGEKLAQFLQQIEKAKQDDTLSDFSDVLGQLKGMALDMSTEMDRQNKAWLPALHDDVEELNSRVKGANRRTRRLLGK